MKEKFINSGHNPERAEQLTEIYNSLTEGYDRPPKGLEL